MRSVVVSSTVAIQALNLDFLGLLDQFCGHVRRKTVDEVADPGEVRNLAESRAQDTERLRDRAQQHLESETPWEGGAPEVEIDEMHLRQLRALGYSIE